MGLERHYHQPKCEHIKDAATQCSQKLHAMTTATCIYCGALKFGAFVPCQQCKRIPLERGDVIRSLALTDHYFTNDQLADFGTQIRNGRDPKIDKELEARLSSEIDDNTLQTLERMTDPALREYYRKREQFIILIIMATIVTLIGWMFCRFAVT
jgi:hypothetical protein